MEQDARELRRTLAGATVRRDGTVLCDDDVRRAALRWPQLGGRLLLV